MSDKAGTRPRTGYPWTRPMPLRDHTVAHRASTPLELLFDLCFVVSVAVLAEQLHEAVIGGHALDGAIRYLLLFVPVWWAWMLFSWFASAFDNDDVPYRLLTLAQMAGVLGIAASMPSAYHGDFTPLTITFVLARIPLIIQWVRGARHHPDERTFALRYAKGIAGCQVLWLVLLAVPLPGRYLGYLVLLVLELSVPRWAVAGGKTQAFHVGHITERYGLFTLIVLGESILAATTAMQRSIGHGVTPALLVIGASTLVSAFTVWWLYFDFVDGQALMAGSRAAFGWGYGHLLVFSAIGAMGAGVEIAVDAYQRHSFGLAEQLALALPAAICVGALAWIRSLSAGAGRGITLSRIGPVPVIVAAALAFGGSGPAATTAAVATVLATGAIAETVLSGLRLRRNGAPLTDITTS